jgi:hypothetical protein
VNSVYLEKTVGGEVSLSDAGREVAETLEGLFRAVHKKFNHESRRLLSQVLVTRAISGLGGLVLLVLTLESAVTTTERIIGGLVTFLAFLIFGLMDWIGRLRLARFWVYQCRQVRPAINHILTAHPTFRIALRQVSEADVLTQSIDYALLDDSAIRESVLYCQGTSLLEYHRESVGSVNSC